MIGKEEKKKSGHYKATSSDKQMHENHGKPKGI